MIIFFIHRVFLKYLIVANIYKSPNILKFNIEKYFSFKFSLNKESLDPVLNQIFFFSKKLIILDSFLTLLLSILLDQ